METKKESILNNSSDITIKNIGISLLPGEKEEWGRFPECFTVRYSKTDRFLGVGMSSGKIHLLDPHNSFKHEINILASDYAVTSIRFKGDSSVMSVSADGKVSSWHTLTGKKLHSFEEPNNPIMCLDMNYDYSKFATAGNDKTVRLYDDDTKTLIHDFKPNYYEIGHSNRIFAVTFSKTDPNIIVSGGWDSILVFYDIRQKSIIGNCLGAHICGDALDLKDNLVLAGSWKTKDQVKIFDMKKFELIETVDWGFDKEDRCSYAYSAQFSKLSSKKSMFAVGGSNKNILRLWGYEEKNRSKQSGVDDLPGAVYSIDFSNISDNIAIGCGDGKVRLYDIKYNS